MRKETEKKTNCPDIEFVSAYFDGELDAASAEYKHIKDCPECREHLDSYQKLADSIKGEFDAAVPNDLAERIISGVKRRNYLEAQPTTLNFPVLMKVAAMFILIACILYLVIPKAPPRPPEVGEDLGAPPEFLNEDIPSGKLTIMQVPSRERIANTNGSIDLEHFFPASTKASREINFVSDDTEEKPAWIPAAVKQVWVVKEVSSGLKEMEKLANKKEILSTGKNSQGDAELNLKITKLELVNLIRKLHKAGFKLVSPTQPQPEQNTFAGNKDEVVSYKAILTEK